MDQHDNTAKPIAVTIDDARGALGPRETIPGDTLMPMLVVGLTLVVVAITVVVFAV